MTPLLHISGVHPRAHLSFHSHLQSRGSPPGPKALTEAAFLDEVKVRAAVETAWNFEWAFASSGLHLLNN